MTDESEDEDYIVNLISDIDERDDALIFISELAENLLECEDVEDMKKGMWMIKQIAEEFQCES